jgi:hypothetical protein
MILNTFSPLFSPISEKITFFPIFTDAAAFFEPTFSVTTLKNDDFGPFWVQIGTSR